MTRRTLRTATALGRKTLETAVAAPQVVVSRLGRMATAGPVPSLRDQKEFVGMVTEKQLAFTQSWIAMVGETWRLQQQIWLSLWAMGATPGWSAPRASLSVARQLQSAAVSIADKGIAPVHRKAVSNARRLSRRSGRG